MTREILKNALAQAIQDAQKENLLPSFVLPEIIVERPQQKDHGDYASSVAMKIAGVAKAKRTPQGIAETIVAKLTGKLGGTVKEIKIILPGFINFSLANEYLQKEVREILVPGQTYGRLNLGQNKKVQVEFISANPTGPLTLGNARGGFLGDALASVLQAAGWQAQREFYINDAGEQITKLGHSILGDAEAVYQGEYIDELRAGLVGKPKDAKTVGRAGAKVIIEHLIRPVVEKKMKIKFDNWFWESELHAAGKIEEVLKTLKSKKVTYEKDGALWFKTTQFGDDKDRVLVKSDGQPTYALVDAAYHLNKFKDRGFDRVIDIWGADHAGDVARVKAAVEVLGFGGKLEMILCQLVRLIKDGQEVKMSKRAGVYVTVKELIDEVGLDAVRFFMLTRSAGSHLDFDLALAKEQSPKNPVYYVQYAYARICSLLAKEKGVNRAAKSQAKISGDAFNLSSDEAELTLVKQLIKLPEVVADTALDYQVQRLPQYAMELVRAFHKFYEECRVISEDKAQTASRLALVEATRIVLKEVLGLMGISAPEHMEHAPK